MAPTPVAISGEDGPPIDLEDYMKWRVKNNHIGVQYVNPGYPQIFIPSSASVKDDESGQKVCIAKKALGKICLTSSSVLLFLVPCEPKPRSSFWIFLRVSFIQSFELPRTDYMYPELRNLIYENAFLVDCTACRSSIPHLYDYETGCVGSTATETNIYTLKQRLSHPIFRTSRQVRCESLYVFFSCHTWKISYLPEFIPFLNFIGSYCRASLRTLWIEDVFYQGIWSPDFVSDIVKILNGLGGLQRLYIDFTLESLAQVPGALTSPQLALQTSGFKPLLSLRGLTQVKLSFAAEARFSNDCMWADRERAFWAMWDKDFVSRSYFPRRNLNGKSQKEVAMSFLQGLESELQKTAYLPREAETEIDHFGVIQWKPCDVDCCFAQLSPYRNLLPEEEDDAASEDAHTTESEESEEEWLDEWLEEWLEDSDEEF